MMKTLIPTLTLLAIGACYNGAAAPPTPTTSQPTTQITTRTTSRPTKLTEKQKIEALIAHIENLEDAVFIRNDAEHNCREAAKHMRDKWQWKRKEIKTARDFINVAATKSSTSGRPYLIRFKNGREEKCGEYLLARLKQLEQPTTPTSHPTTKSSGS